MHAKLRYMRQNHSPILLIYIHRHYIHIYPMMLSQILRAHPSLGLLDSQVV